VKALHEETEAIYKENQSLNRQQIALNEEVPLLRSRLRTGLPGILQTF